MQVLLRHYLICCGGVQPGGGGDGGVPCRAGYLAVSALLGPRSAV